MKLTKQAIKSLNDRAIRLHLCLELGFTEPWVNKLIEKNKDNGPLTTIKALQIIKQETGLKEDQILEKEKVAG